MKLYPETKTSALDLLKKQSTIDQHPNSQLKFSIASLLFNDQLPTKKATFEQYQKSIKYEHHHSENNNCLDLSCFTCKPSSIKNYFGWCNSQKQHKVKDLNTLASKLNSEQTILNQPLNQFNSQISQQLSHQLNQQIMPQLNQQLNLNISNRSSLPTPISNQQSVSPVVSIQSQLQSQFNSQLQTSIHSSLSHHTSTNGPSPLQLNSITNSVKHHKSTNFNHHQASVVQISDYLNSLKSNQNGGCARVKITNQSISNKKKRVRTIFTQEQLDQLEKEFERTQYMVGHDRLNLAARLGLSEVQVKVWFQNRRIKHRKGDIEKKAYAIRLI